MLDRNAHGGYTDNRGDCILHAVDTCDTSISLEEEKNAMKFTKMHGLSNDYIYADGFTQTLPADPAEVSIRLSKYHTGIGADGLILIEPTENADARMRIFNADGSEAQICGNGLRCVARYLYDHNLCKKTEMRILTGAGLKIVRLNVEDESVLSVTADMGAPVVSKPAKLTAAGRTLTFWPVSMGNPHAVTFEESAKGAEFYALGPAFEKHAFFPERANIEFTEAVDRTHLHVRVWERGSGETMACGSGACAVLVAAVSAGLCERKAQVVLPGGALTIEWRETDGHILMTGPATTVFEGEISV
jgi:diaminopimelate epimerase